MSWKFTENRVPKGKQDIQVKMLLKEMAQYTYATYSEQIEWIFKGQVREIPRTNNFSADLLYQVKKIDAKVVEIWKMTADGDFKYKMFTLEYVG